MYTRSPFPSGKGQCQTRGFRNGFVQRRSCILASQAEHRCAGLVGLKGYQCRRAVTIELVLLRNSRIRFTDWLSRAAFTTHRLDGTCHTNSGSSGLDGINWDGYTRLDNLPAISHNEAKSFGALRIQAVSEIPNLPRAARGCPIGPSEMNVEQAFN